MEHVEKRRLILQETMNFLGAMASGIEEALGDPAKSITYAAGKKLGKSFAVNVKRVDGIEDALEEVRKVLEHNECLWTFEPFKPKGHENLLNRTEDGEEIMLIFRDCMIRQSLFRFGHHQKGSLCNMMNGFFVAAIQTIMGLNSRLEIAHAGENACLKKLTLAKKIHSSPI